MSDMWSELPLSRKRAADDESTVTNDWRLPTVDALRALAALLEGLTDEQLAHPALPTPVDRHIGGSTVLARATQVVGDLDQRPLDRLLRRRARSGVGDPVAALRVRADQLAGSEDRGSLHTLSTVVQASADISIPLGAADPIASRSSGAVALSLAAAAPTGLSAVLRGRSLVPDDAEWVIARGPAIRGSSAELIAWLGLRDVTPRFDPTS